MEVRAVRSLGWTTVKRRCFHIQEGRGNDWLVRVGGLRFGAPNQHSSCTFKMQRAAYCARTRILHTFRTFPGVNTTTETVFQPLSSSNSQQPLASPPLARRTLISSTHTQAQKHTQPLESSSYVTRSFTLHLHGARKLINKYNSVSDCSLSTRASPAA